MKKFATILAATAFATAAFAQQPADTVAPSYPGGKESLDKYISTNLQYPKAAASNCIEGVVQVAFHVKPDGTLEDFSIVRLIDPDLEEEALRLAKGMPAWQPATKGGTPVESEAQIQVVFSLSE